MPVSKEKLRANQLNARKSTGPKTQAGKDKSSKNATKHGVLSETAVLPSEDPKEYQKHVDSWMDDFRPESAVRAHMVERLALHAWRLKRCVRVENETLRQGFLEGLAEYDEDLRAEADDLLASDLHADPSGTLGVLLRSRAGVDAVQTAWSELVGAMMQPAGWVDESAHHDRLFALLDLDEDGEDYAELSIASRRLMLHDAGSVADPEGGLEPFTDEEANKTRELLMNMMERRSEDLTAIQSRLPDPSRDARRARFAEMRAMQDPNHELIARYEGRLDREFRAMLSELRALSKTDIDLQAPAASEGTIGDPQCEVPAPNEARSAEVEAGEGAASESAESPPASTPRAETPTRTIAPIVADIRPSRPVPPSSSGTA